MAKLNAKLYKWYEFKGKKTTITSEKGSIILSRGMLFGIKTVAGKYSLVGIALDVQMRLPEASAIRLIQNSKGFSGKIGTVVVKAGEGGLDTFDRSKGDVKIDSGMFLRGHYDASKKLLTLEFRSKAIWQYKDVSAKEVMEFETSKSQGRYYNDKIKNVKDGQRLDRHSFSSESASNPYGHLSGLVHESALPPQPVERIVLREGSRVTFREDPESEPVYWCVVDSIYYVEGVDGALAVLFMPVGNKHYAQVAHVPVRCLTLIQDTHQSCSSSPVYYVAKDLPQITEFGVMPLHAVGETVDVMFGSNSDGPPEHIMTGCVVACIRHYPNKIAYDVYVPDGMRLEQLSSDSEPLFVQTYTMLENVDSVCVTKSPSTSISSNAPAFYTQQDLPAPPSDLVLTGASAFRIGDAVKLSVDEEFIEGCYISAIHYYQAKVAYDVYVPIGASEGGTTYSLFLNIDSVLISHPV